jgi:hypothetical protein
VTLPSDMLTGASSLLSPRVATVGPRRQEARELQLSDPPLAIGKAHPHLHDESESR